VGSGLNGQRQGLLAALRSPDDGALVVEQRDRLARFGPEYMEAALAATGRGVVVVDPEEVKDDLVQDMIEVLTSRCVRRCGRRSAGKRAEKALQAASEA
jgi:putative resolvase